MALRRQERERERKKKNKTKHTIFLWPIIKPTFFSDTNLRGCPRSSRAVERTPSPTHSPHIHNRIRIPKPTTTRHTFTIPRAPRGCGQ
jgi:hypothetical protein